METPDGIFYVKALKFKHVRKVLKDSGVAKVQIIGQELPHWNIDLTDIQYYLLLEAVADENGNPITPEKLDNLSVDTINILTSKALELTPIFRILATTYTG